MRYLIMGLFSFLTSMFTSAQSFSAPENLIIIDVRTPQEVAESRVPGAKNIDLFSENFKKEIGQLDKNLDYGVYCRSGNRSGQAVQYMQSIGFKNAMNLGSVEQAAKKLKLQCEGC